jgi:hypothetical protein
MNNALKIIRNKEIDLSGIHPAALIAFIKVESGGRGFSSDNKLIIQFEPRWFAKKQPYAPSGKWSLNGIEKQSQEWIAFNDACQISRESAIESTSLGLPQIMGFHWKRLGYASAFGMWDDFSAGEKNQLIALVNFIKTDKRLFNAIKELDWHIVAMIYNGAGYAALAHKIGREPYNVSMSKAYRDELANEGIY